MSQHHRSSSWSSSPCLLAVLFLFTTARRRDRAAAVGSLSRETRRTRPQRRGRRRRIRRPRTTPRHRPRGRAASRPRAARRRPSSPPRAPAPPAARAPARRRGLGVTRRQFLNRGIVDHVRPRPGRLRRRHARASCGRTLSGGFGSKIRAGNLERHPRPDRRHQGAVLRRPRAASTSSRIPKDDVAKAKQVYATAACSTGMEDGVVALYQKCVHLGCRVPWCKTSQWFECPCHGSQYNRVGEKKGGPAPRGLDRFPVDGRGRHGRRRHRPAHPRPAHRHQHHRPGGRGPALRRERSRACSWPPRNSGSGSPSSSSSCWLDRLPHRAARPQPGRRPAPRSSCAPNRKPYFDDEASRAHGSTATWAGRSCCCASPPSACPLYWLREPSRQEGAGSTGLRPDRGGCSGASSLLRSPSNSPEHGSRTSAAQNCHGADGAGRRRAVHAHRPYLGPRSARCSGRLPAAQHGACSRFRRPRSCAASSSTAGPTRRCRRGASRAAAR